MNETETTAADEVPKLQLLRMQPTFQRSLPWPTEESIARVRAGAAVSDFRDHVAAAGSVIDFRIEDGEQRFWSPHLSVQLSDSDKPGETDLLARFSPRPEIWTMFMAVYAVMFITACGAAIYGYVQHFLGQTPWSLVAIPMCLLVIFGLHAGSLIGQNLSRDQMQVLIDRLDQVLAKAVSSPSPINQ